MSEWQSYSLGELADIRISNVDKKSKPNEDTAKLCNYMDVYSNDYITANLTFMQSTASPLEQTRFRVDEGDVLITKDSETPYDIGISSVVLNDIEDLVCGYHLALIKPNRERVNSIFLSKQLAGGDVSSYFSRVAAGSTRYGLSNGAIANTKVTLPSLAKQNKIAEILFSIDRAIASTEALIEKYQHIKAGLMHDLFTRGIGADGKLRPPREQTPELYRESKDRAIGWIPKEWELKTVESIKESLVDGPFGSNLKTEHYVTDPGVRVVRLQNIQSAKYNDDDKAFVSEKHANFLLRNKVVGDDILIAGLGEERYPVGRACLYPEDLSPALNKADCFRLRCSNDEMVNNFAMYFLNTSAARNQVRRYEQGVTRPRINLGNLKKILIPKPKLTEQLLVSSRLNELSHRINVEISKKKKLELQKSGLMHDLLTGQVYITPAPTVISND